MELFFAILALLIVVSGIGVVFAHDPIHSALWLVLNLFAVAGIFALLDAHFLAAVQIIVYAGAIMVLVLFVLMLLNLKVEEQKPFGKITLVLATVLGLGFLFIAVPLINAGFSSFPEPTAGIQGTVKAIGQQLYTTYVFPFEAASVLIMAAMVGAVMLSKRKYK